MDYRFDDPFALGIIALALFMGGVLKGATGAGAPVVAVPVIAAFFDVRLGVILMAAPNLFTNLRQLQSYWPYRLGQGFSLRFALSSALGAIAGTVLLATLSGNVLSLMLAGAVILYIGLRLARPDWRLAEQTARKIVVPIGAIGGVLQGATGISAPVAVSFLNAMRLDRQVFIPTISSFFSAMALVQIPALLLAGLLTKELAVMSALALLPLLAGMPVGERLARYMSPASFDRVLLALLVVMSARLLWVSMS